MYHYGFYGFWDPTLILVLIGAIVVGIASSVMKGTYSRYARIRSASGMTGQETARRILDSQGLFNVSVQHVPGSLTDHYDPRTRTVRLSDATFSSTSVAAVGVAAHECGHAVQHADGYLPLTARTMMVPAVNIGAQLSWPMIMIGLFTGMGGNTMIHIGILLFSLSVLFQLVTLPVEFDASHRALGLLQSCGILYGNEVSGSRKVLTAAALTYVAAAANSLLQMLRLMMLFGGRRRD